MYAVLQVPCFALQAVLSMDVQSRGECSWSSPLVVVEPDAKKPVVLEMTDAAGREGIVLGLSIPQALARCEDLVVRYRSGQAESLLEELLFSLAYSLSPRVEPDGLGEVLVDLRGVKREEALERCGRIVDELAAIGVSVGIGVAESCVVAGLAAGESEGGVLLVDASMELSPATDTEGASSLKCLPEKRFMEALPLGRMRMSDGLADVLAKWGIRTLAAFASLKRSAIGARLGVEGLQLWDRVTGREQRVVSVAELPLDFEESWGFEYDVDSVDPLLFILRRFLDTLTLRMRAAHKVAALMRVELGLAYGEPLRVEQKLPEPTSDAEALFRLLSGRMEGLEAESPVARLTLLLEVVDFKERQLGLFESSLKNPYRFTQTLSKVAGIIGADRVGRPVLEPDRRPDGFRLEALPAAVPPMPDTMSLDCKYGMPLRRFRPSLRAEVEFQGRQPNWFQCELVGGFVKAVRGPWLHSGHWWEDNGNWNRVEWDVELNKGGVYRLSKDENGWSVQGGY